MKLYATLTIFVLAIIGFYFFTYTDSQAQTKNGFDLSGSLIPTSEILGGGPPRDGIPSIDSPKFLSPKEATFLEDSDRLLGISRNGVTRAYPIKILNWHEIVNDTFGKESVVVSFCPLCGSGVAFTGQEGKFGVSGLLYNSDVLLYDHKTESLWSQLLGKAVAGPKKGTQFQPLFMSHTTWGAWKKRHPKTQVLSTETGFSRDYQRDPYQGYDRSDYVMFPVSHEDKKYHSKETVLGIEIKGKSKAFPFSELAKGAKSFKDNIGGKEIRIQYDEKSKSAFAVDSSGKEVPGVILFWFAWVAFHPDTEVYQPKP